LDNQVGHNIGCRGVLILWQAATGKKGDVAAAGIEAAPENAHQGIRKGDRAKATRTHEHVQDVSQSVYHESMPEVRHIPLHDLPVDQFAEPTVVGELGYVVDSVTLARYCCHHLCSFAVSPKRGPVSPVYGVTTDA